METIRLQDFLYKSINKLSIFVTIIGTIWLIFAASHNYEFFDAGLLPEAILVIVLGTYVYIKFSDTAQRRILKLHYGIVINVSASERLNSSTLRIGGTFKNQPEKNQVYVMEYDPVTNYYWPKNEPTYDNSSKTWQTTIGLESGFRDDRTLIIAFVGVNSLPLIEYYLQCNRDRVTGTNIPIIGFPKEFCVLDGSTWLSGIIDEDFG
ncbi:hypothetical protein [Puia dinghuensis]|nr:hypothetical protein [Puia dinghuensis]